MPYHDPKAISRLARSMGYYEVELSTTQQSRACKFKHMSKLGGVTVEVFYKSATVQVSQEKPRGRRYPALIRRNQTWQDLLKILEFPSTETNVPPSRLADGTPILRSWSDPGLEMSLSSNENMQFLRSKEAIIDKTLDSVSCGIDSIFLLYTDGSFAHSSHIPRQLYSRLEGRQADHVRPEIVKLGKRSAESFFIQYADGQYEWADMEEELDRLLEQNTSGVDVLALGEGDSFFVKFKDGEERWKVPDSLADILEGRENRGRRGVVVGVALGGDGNYCVQYGDGRVCSEVGMREFCNAYDKFNMVEFVELGLRGDWLVTGLVASRRRGVRDRLGNTKGDKVLTRKTRENKASLSTLDWRSKGTRGRNNQGQGSKFKKYRKVPPVPLHAVPGGPGCVCLRKLKLVLCKDCGNTFRGRVRRLCKVHPSSIYLLDMETCKDCQRDQLQELDLPTEMTEGVRNKLVDE